MASPNNASSGPAGAGPPALTMAQIPLPSGLTFEQYLVLQRQLVTIAITVAIALAIVVWDYFVLIRAEIYLWKTCKKELWLAPSTWAFIVLRYSAFLATIPPLWLTSIETQHCQLAVVLHLIGVVLVYASAGLIFCYRVTAVWDGLKPVSAIVSFTWVGMMACWIAVATQQSAITGPPAPFGPNCQIKQNVPWAPITHASSVVFNLLVLILAIAKFKADRRQKSPIGRQLDCESLLYFVVTAAANIAVLSVQALGHAHDMIKPAALSFATIITAAMAERAFFNLKLYTHRQQRAKAGLPISGYSASSQPHNNVYGRPPPQRMFIKPQSYSDDPDFVSSGFGAKSVEYPSRDVVYISRQTVVDHD